MCSKQHFFEWSSFKMTIIQARSYLNLRKRSWSCVIVSTVYFIISPKNALLSICVGQQPVWAIPRYNFAPKYKLEAALIVSHKSRCCFASTSTPHSWKHKVPKIRYSNFILKENMLLICWCVVFKKSLLSDQLLTWNTVL